VTATGTHDRAPALSARNLSVALGGRDIFDGVDLDLYPGELVGLLGPNGAGKTTLMRALMGLIPSRGTVKAGRFGYVPQNHDFAWNYPISVRECVLSGRLGQRKLWQRWSAADYQAASEAIETVNLTDLALRPIGELSGGQKQRVLVARALSTQPDVLFLDEPFTGMDLPRSEELMEVIRRLTDSGMAVLMVSHNLAEARQFSDRLVLLRAGVRAMGTPEELNRPEPWMDTFDIARDSTHLRAIGIEVPN